MSSFWRYKTTCQLEGDEGLEQTYCLFERPVISIGVDWNEDMLTSVANRSSVCSTSVDDLAGVIACLGTKSTSLDR